MPAPEAHAPFNFVPVTEPCGFALDSLEREPTCSGSLSIEIEALEPMLVCGKQEKGQPRRFVRHHGKPYIPGTSLKGVVRTMLEALSISRLGPLSPRRAFFRDLNNKSYLERFVVPDNDVSVYRSRAGFLHKINGRWHILPCEWAKVSHDTLRQKNIRFFEGTRRPVDRLKSLLRCEQSCSGVDGNPPALDDHHHPKPWNQGLTLRYRRLSQFKLGGSGRIVTAGHMGNRHFEAVFYAPRPDAASISVHHAWDDFEEWLDSHRPRRELFATYHTKEAQQYYLRGVPVFWIEAPGSTAASPQVEAFGFSQLFCVPYRHSIDSFAGQRWDEEPLSLAEQIFGFVDLRVGHQAISRRGRVSFGPAICTGDFKELSPRRVIPGNPSATCLGLYLVQPPPHKVQRNAQSHGLTTYDNPQAKLRGRKFYWHRKGAWDMPQPGPAAPNNNDRVSAEYAPIARGARFSATVTIDRLTETELGALVAALQLPEGHAHKIGLGKAFGLGSARVSIKALELSMDHRRYASLRGRSSQTKIAERFLHDCEARFKARIAEICDCDFESIEEIIELRAMTNYNSAPDAGKTNYMPLERAHNQDRDSSVYANKPVLPEASTIARRANP